MDQIGQPTTHVTVTDLRRRTSDVMEQAESGSVVVVQKDNEPQGVYLSYRRYQAILARLDKAGESGVGPDRRFPQYSH